MTLSRRSLITGLISFVAAPAIVRVSSLMPVKVMEPMLMLNGVPIEFDGGFSNVEPIYFQERMFWISGTHTVSWGPETLTKRFDAALDKWAIE